MFVAKYIPQISKVIKNHITNSKSDNTYTCNITISHILLLHLERICSLPDVLNNIIVEYLRKPCFNYVNMFGRFDEIFEWELSPQEYCHKTYSIEYSIRKSQYYNHAYHINITNKVLDIDLLNMVIKVVDSKLYVFIDYGLGMRTNNTIWHDTCMYPYIINYYMKQHYSIKSYLKNVKSKESLFSRTCTRIEAKNYLKRLTNHESVFVQIMIIGEIYNTLHNTPV